MGRALSALGLALALLAGLPARAGTCSVESVVGVSFGSYDVFSPTALDSTGSITFLCTGVFLFQTVTVDISQGSSNSYSPRKMFKSSTALNYNLYTNAARTSVWGDGSGSTDHYGPVAPLLGTNTTLTVYGRVPARQSVSVGAYHDTVVVSVIF